MLLLLYNDQRTKLRDNPGWLLHRLLEDLSKKADEAEDALDEVHYFMIKDEVEGTQEAIPEVDHGLCSQARHGYQAVRHTVGNWLSSFPCCLPLPQDDVDKLTFDRVAMSNKIKQLIQYIDSKRPIVSDLLNNHINISNPGSMVRSLERPPTSSRITQDTLYGRSTIFEKTINHMTNAARHETLSVLPIVGPGGIGKTTFARHLYNDNRTKEHFAIRIWVCVSNNSNVLELTREILSYTPVPESETGSVNQAHESTNLDLLQKSIAERLKSKRFLIVLDDIWQSQCNGESEWYPSKWESLISSFTNKEAEKGSMVLITTRFPQIAEMTVKATDQLNLQGLEPSEFWEFFKACVFGEAIAEQGLIETARKIANKLKCSPLAAKTVGRLMKKDPSLEHWNQILGNKGWLNQTNSDDIMPALKISYDYLPFHLKKCFLYCSLFPEDHWFDNLDISNFWAAIGILDSSGQSGKVEDIGSKYLDELVDNGFLMRGDGDYFVMHDLFHELAQTVSSQECLNISCSSFKADTVPPTIRHITITMGGECSNDFKQQMDKLKKKIDIVNLRTLMISGSYDTYIDNVLKDVFKEMKGLRVLSTFMNSQELFPSNFGKLIHLRYLKISSRSSSTLYLPSTLGRFYHLEFLDLNDWGGCNDLPKNICHLKNLRHFRAGRELHSNVPEVGNMMHLQELKEFHVKKESIGFDMSELGNLTELGRGLSICNLENVTTKEEAKEAKLMDKNNLGKLRLVWSKRQPSGGVDIVDGLQPHSSLRSLDIVNHPGDIGPTWLCYDKCFENLESLNLEGISWVKLPPFGLIPGLRELELKNIVGLRQFGLDLFGGFTDKSCLSLKRIGFCDMPELVEWVVGGASSPCLFSALESIACGNCPNLSRLWILDYSAPSTQGILISTPSLRTLEIYRCPKLSLPPMPHTSTLTFVNVNLNLMYERTKLVITGNHCDLAFHNLGNIENLGMYSSRMSLNDLQKLNSLRRLELKILKEHAFFWVLGDGSVLSYSVEILKLWRVPLTSKSLSNVFKCFPAVSDLDWNMSSPWKLDHEEGEVLLQLPSSSSMRRLAFRGCKNLILPAAEDAGVLPLRELMSLQSLTLQRCGRILSLWSTVGEATHTEVINPFPASLRELCISGEPSLRAMGLLSNLTSLTHLTLKHCANLTLDGFNPRIMLGLKSLDLVNSGQFKLSSIRRWRQRQMKCLHLLQPRRQDLGALGCPLCSRFSTTLQKLIFTADCFAERLTEEQEQVLRRITSLRDLRFIDCLSLESLPAALHLLSSLEELHVARCLKISSLPKEGLPTSLKGIVLFLPTTGLREDCKKLEETRPDLHIHYIARNWRLELNKGIGTDYVAHLGNKAHYQPPSSVQTPMGIQLGNQATTGFCFV